MSEPPYKTRSTESLRYGKGPSPIPVLVNTPSETTSNLSSSSSVGVRRDLEQETERKLRELIGEMRARGKGPLKNNSNLTQRGHNKMFHVPTQEDMSALTAMNARSNSGGGNVFSNLIDGFTDSMGINKQEKKIDKQMLIDNGVALSDIISQNISITELYSAWIVRDFGDLMDIGFKPGDLVQNRMCFSCDMLGNLFHTNYAKIIATGIHFNITHLLKEKFKASDLMALKYNLAPYIDSGEIKLLQIKALNMDADSLKEIGLNKLHLRKLGITKNLAILERPEGLEWSSAEFESFF